jgi:DNA-binding protein Fis
MQNYPTRSDAVHKIIKSLSLTRTLSVSSILLGEPHTGKRTLVRTLFPDLPFVDGRDQDAVEKLLSETDALVIDRYDKLPNADRLQWDNKRIIAIADRAGNMQKLDEIFAFIYTMPPLRNRPEDIDLYAELYREEACRTLQIDPPVVLDSSANDVHENHRSLRASIYREVLLTESSAELLERGLYRYFLNTLPHQADYRTLLRLFEKPLLKAGLEVFGSQLRLSEALGINRNTLRKKIHEHL